MKRIVIWAVIIIGVISLALMGFQCSSAELTSAKLYIQRKDYQNAEVQLQKELSKNPKSEEAWFLLGQVRTELRDYRGMKDAYLKALEIAPTHKKEIDNYTNGTWGQIFNFGVEKINSIIDSTGQLDTAKASEAVEAFKLATYLMPDSLMNQENLGYAYYKRGDLDSAIAALSTVLEKRASMFSIKLLSGIYATKASEYKTKFNDQNQSAMDDMKHLEQIKEKMKGADVKYLLGQPSSVKQEKTGKGKNATVSKEEWIYNKFNLSVTVEKDMVTKISFSTEYTPNIDSTNYKRSIEEYKKAIDVLKQGLQLDPSDAEISENLMNAYIGADMNAEARMLLDDRVQKYPDSKFDRYNLGVFLLKENKFEDAVNEFKAALDIDPVFSSATYNLAATYVNWGVAEQERLKKAGKEEDKSYQEKYKMAIPYLEKVTEEKPDDVIILELLGQVYANLGQKDKAKDAYDKADAIRQGRK